MSYAIFPALVTKWLRRYRGQKGNVAGIDGTRIIVLWKSRVKAPVSNGQVAHTARYPAVQYVNKTQPTPLRATPNPGGDISGFDCIIGNYRR